MTTLAFYGAILLEIVLSRTEMQSDAGGRDCHASPGQAAPQLLGSLSGHPGQGVELPSHLCPAWQDAPRSVVEQAAGSEHVQGVWVHCIRVCAEGQEEEAGIAHGEVHFHGVSPTIQGLGVLQPGHQEVLHP